MKSLFTLLVLFSISTAFAQDYPPIEGTSQSTISVADKIANAYDAKLSMTGEQKALMKLELEHYLKLRENIIATKKGTTQLDALVNLQAEETLAMNDILTREQMIVYKRVKTEIEPLKMVKPPIKKQSKSKTD